MVIRHLEILEAIAETGTFTSAAKKTAFCNWMDRDILFAQEVQRQCT